MIGREISTENTITFCIRDRNYGWGRIDSFILLYLVENGISNLLKMIFRIRYDNIW